MSLSPATIIALVIFLASTIRNGRSIALYLVTAISGFFLGLGLMFDIFWPFYYKLTESTDPFAVLLRTNSSYSTVAVILLLLGSESAIPSHWAVLTPIFKWAANKLDDGSFSPPPSPSFTSEKTSMPKQPAFFVDFPAPVLKPARVNQYPMTYRSPMVKKCSDWPPEKKSYISEPQLPIEVVSKKSIPKRWPNLVGIEPPVSTYIPPPPALADCIVEEQRAVEQPALPAPAAESPMLQPSPYRVSSPLTQSIPTAPSSPIAPSTPPAPIATPATPSPAPSPLSPSISVSPIEQEVENILPPLPAVVPEPVREVGMDEYSLEDLWVPIPEPESQNLDMLEAEDEPREQGPTEMTPPAALPSLREPSPAREMAESDSAMVAMQVDEITAVEIDLPDVSGETLEASPPSGDSEAGSQEAMETDELSVSEKTPRAGSTMTLEQSPASLQADSTESPDAMQLGGSGAPEIAPPAESDAEDGVKGEVFVDVTHSAPPKTGKWDEVREKMRRLHQMISRWTVQELRDNMGKGHKDPYDFTSEIDDLDDAKDFILNDRKDERGISTIGIFDDEFVGWITALCKTISKEHEKMVKSPKKKHIGRLRTPLSAISAHVTKNNEIQGCSSARR